MPTYQQYEQQFSQDLVGSSTTLRGAATGGMPPALQALINALPYYGSPDLQGAHRGALANLLESQLPNNGIAAHPFDYGFGYSLTYSYNGSYSGYANAFYTGIGMSSSAQAVYSAVNAVNSGINTGWWGNYGVAALTDAIRQVLGFSLDSGKLSTDLSNYNAGLLPALTASYCSILTNGFSPTANAYAAIVNSGQKAQALTDLVSAISKQQFTANINQAISMGGDSTNAAVWFLYNLWSTLKILGSSNVDASISQFQSQGLTVPAQVGPARWWNGGYTSWYYPLSGSDVLSVARNTITAGMPETEMAVYSGSPFPVTTHPTEPNGYSESLCYWGSLSWYQPPPSSCLGRGTGVLMSDGSVKPVEEVRIGDQIRTGAGTGRVGLIETPSRNKRVLYQVNGLNLYVTSAHPFRTSEPGGPKRRAVDAWTLIDSIPTMTKDGIGSLSTGSVLSGFGADTTVESIVAHDPPESDEVVYDLIIEGYPAFYVGGPDVFLAVEAEASDPDFDPACTLAVTSAMRAAKEASQKTLTNPAQDLPALLRRVSPQSAVAPARKSALRLQDATPQSTMVGRDFYIKDGGWDPHASMLESSLVRQFGRVFRRETATAWRALPQPPEPGDILSVLIYDIELIGESPVPAGLTAAIMVNLSGWDSGEDRIRSLDLGLRETPAWHLLPDTSLDFGPYVTSDREGFLNGSLEVAGEVVGCFRVSVPTAGDSVGISEHFLFGSDSKVIGRIALEQRRISKLAHGQEKTQAEVWDHNRRSSLAISLGRQVGEQLARTITSP